MFLCSDVFITNLLTKRPVYFAHYHKLGYFPVLFLALFVVFRLHYSACFLVPLVGASSSAARLVSRCLSPIFRLFFRVFSLSLFHVLVACLLFYVFLSIFSGPLVRHAKKMLGLFIGCFCLVSWNAVSNAVSWQCNFPPKKRGFHQCDISRTGLQYRPIS